MGGNFQKVGNSLDFFISETKHRIFNFSGPLRNFPSFGEIGGSGHKPREYDGRLPPDAGYYLDLVLPRSEESRKKNTCKL